MVAIRHPTVVAAIQRQTATLATHTRYLHEDILEYAEQLTARHPHTWMHVIFREFRQRGQRRACGWPRWPPATGAAGHGTPYHGITDAVAALTPGVGTPRDLRVVTIAPPPRHLRVSVGMGAAELKAAVQDADGAITRLGERGSSGAFFVDTPSQQRNFDPPAVWAGAVTARVRAAGGLVVATRCNMVWAARFAFLGIRTARSRPDIVIWASRWVTAIPWGGHCQPRIDRGFSASTFLLDLRRHAVAAAPAPPLLEVLNREQPHGQRGGDRRLLVVSTGVVSSPGTRAWAGARPAAAWWMSSARCSEAQCAPSGS